MRLFVRLSCALLVAAASPGTSYAAGDETEPLCPPSQAGCVTSNWGQTEPDGLDASVAPTGPMSLARATRGRISMAVQPMPVALRGASGAATVKSYVSPSNLFPKETNALLAAIKRARFNRDGSVATGADAIRSAAADVARKADKRYFLSLYVKTPTTLAPEQRATLFKRVDAVNAAIGSVPDGKRAN